MRLLLLCFSLFFASTASASYIPDWIPCCCDVEKTWALEVRCSCYVPQSKQLKKIYSDEWFYYEVEASKRVTDHFEVWTSIGWTGKQDGKTVRAYAGFKDKTKISIVPVSLGIKMIFALHPCLDFYVGGGGCYSFLNIQNHSKTDYSCYGFSSSPFKRFVHDYRFGGVGKVGITYSMSSTTFLDIFVDYYAQRFNFGRHHGWGDENIFEKSICCDGFKFGAGFGVYF